MNAVLTDQQKQDFLNRGFSRRSSAASPQCMGAGAAVLPFYNEPAFAQLSTVGNVPPDAVMINANENPLGPCTGGPRSGPQIDRSGRPRISTAKATACRKLLAGQEGVKPRLCAGPTRGRAVRCTSPCWLSPHPPNRS